MEGSRPGLWWPAMEELITAIGKVDQEGDTQKETTRPRQHLPNPTQGRTKGRLLIEVHPVICLTISSTRVPYEESIGDFVAKNRSTMDALTRAVNTSNRWVDKLIDQYIRVHQNGAGADARVDTLMAVVSAEDAERDGALLYDLQMSDTGPCREFR